MPDKDLRDALLVREFQNRVSRLEADQGLRMSSEFASIREVLSQVAKNRSEDAR